MYSILHSIIDVNRFELEVKHAWIDNRQKGVELVVFLFQDNSSSDEIQWQIQLQSKLGESLLLQW